MTAFKRLLILLVCAGAALAQNGYTLVYNPTLAGAPLIMTVQIPASSGYDVRFANLTVSLPGSGTCLITIERDGTAATATVATIVKTNPGVTPVASKSQAYTVSDVGVGTMVAKHLINLGSPITIDMSKQWLGVKVTGTTARNAYATRQNLTIRSCNLTGDATANLDWTETRP